MDDRFFEDGLETSGPIFRYGMHLQVIRCQSIMGAQVFKSLFYTLVMKHFCIDDEICDALVSHSDFKQSKMKWFERAYPRGQ